MNDEQREQLSRHYDSIQWNVITIFTAGVGALTGYSLSQSPKESSTWPEIGALALILLGLFYVASFRSFRNHLHGEIDDPKLRAFLENPAGRSLLPRQWDAFVLSFLLLSCVLTYRLAAKLGCSPVVWTCWSLFVLLPIFILWRSGKRSLASRGGREDSTK